jgi:hypothetical protein
MLAYIDAGTGSLLVQLLAGGLAGVAAFTRFRWTSIRRRFGKDTTIAEPSLPEE